MARICGQSNKGKNWFNYDFVLNELSKDYDIEGIDRIGFTDDGYEIFVVTDDDILSDVPHFHYRKKEKGKACEFHTCIRFDKPEYYHHLGNEDTLNSEQKENLIKFLMTKDKKIGKNKFTNWEWLILSWNSQNNEIKIADDLIVPNYKKLK